MKSSTTPPELQAYLKNLNRTKSLRKIAKEEFEGKVSYGVIARMIKGIEPKRIKIRHRIGLSSLFAVQGITGTIIEGGAVIGVNSKTCAKRICNIEFIPNTANRKYCYYCSSVKFK